MDRRRDFLDLDNYVGRKRALAFVLLALCSACKPSPTDIRSQIGSEDELPPAKVYPDEDISITLWNLSKDKPDQISIVISPDRNIFVRRYQVDWLAVPPKVDTQTLDAQRLSAPQFERLRRRLSSYRPSRLEPGGPFILPRGCDFMMHGQGVINISFRDLQKRTGSFVLQTSCDAPSARKIEQDIKQLLTELPDLRGIAGYGPPGNN